MGFDGDFRVTLLGFAAALAVLAVLFWLIGIGEVLDALAPARLSVVAVVGVVALCWLAAWGLALRSVLGCLGIDATPRQAVVLFAAAQFANNVTPFGQAGGEPVSALLISRSTDAEYETGLAAIASVDALNFVPSIALAAVGLGYYALLFTLGPRVTRAALVVAGLSVAVPALAYTAWRYRRRLERTATRTLTPLLRILGRVLPHRTPPTRQVVRGRVRNFFEDIARVAGDRRRLAVALVFSAAGWIGISASLWLSLYALGHPVPVFAVLVAVPVGAIAGVTPFPGGLGGVETVLVLMLIPTAGLPAATAGAAVVIHRLATYWLPVVLGGGAAATLGAGAVRG